jgi:maltose/moltooligosaccharide transporter
MAAGMLWILDASINISMEPFRALVADLLPPKQRTSGFAIQSFFIGIGAIVASALPYIFTNWLGISNVAEEGVIPPSVRYSFYIGAIVFFSAVLWTVCKTREYPPQDLEAFKKMKEEQRGFLAGVIDIFKSVVKMPKTMIQLAFVQFFSWFALFAMWIYTTPAVTSHIYGTTDASSALFNEGANWVGVLFALYNGFAAIMAFTLPVIAKYTSRKVVHMISLLVGAISLSSFYVISEPMLLLIPMVGIGLTWASILSMPYAILAGSLPLDKMGTYMGLFNAFIVLPQIVAAAILGAFVKYMFGGEAIYALLLGGISFGIAGLLVLLVHDVD